ncbi:hypothetical protein CO663_07765 [Rhizobium anhuiense]|nr:hypothetical protein CO663_07765 [Rhizobium anhuiense]
MSKAHRNILRCRFAERKVILAEASRCILKFKSSYEYCYILLSARVIMVVRFCISNQCDTAPRFLRLRSESDPMQNARKGCDALSEDISIGGTG